MTRAPRSDGTGGFKKGMLVKVRDDVGPRNYTGRHGTVSTVTRVVEEEIVDKLHAEGLQTNNGDFEIGVDFHPGKELSTEAWFLPGELELL